MPLRKDVPQLGASLAGLFDLLVNFIQGHVSRNVVQRYLIPGGRGRKRSTPGRPGRRPRSPRRSGPSSPVAQLVEPVLVDPEVVGELVEDGDADLVLQLLGIVRE